MEKKRLDIVLEERGFAHSRSSAQKLIMAGAVRVNKQTLFKPSALVTHTDLVEVDHGPRFVSRGGEKLLAALESFGMTDLAGKTCVDVGASTGGFTDCLLQHNGMKVYAVDVGYGVLDWKLRNDTRVVVMERTNARYLEKFDAPIQLVTVDASFISLQTLLPVIKKWFVDGTGDVIALIKPQFEAGRAEAARGSGVIRDPQVHKVVLFQVLAKCVTIGFQVKDLIRSPLKGPKGNIEFLVHLSLPISGDTDFEPMIERLHLDGDLEDKASLTEG